MVTKRNSENVVTRNSITRIGLADDHPIIRIGIKSVIDENANFQVIWEAVNGEELLEKCISMPPDIVIIDINMPVLDGISAAKILSEKQPEIKIIFLSMQKDAQIFRSMKAFHVLGYILKDSAIAEIVDCIKRVSSGQRFLSADLTELMFSDTDESSLATPLVLLSNLTPSEKQILTLIAHGKTSREIADKLFISVRTVENHRLNICKRLNIKGNHALLKFAITHANKLKSLTIE